MERVQFISQGIQESEVKQESAMAEYEDHDMINQQHKGTSDDGSNIPMKDIMHEVISDDDNDNKLKSDKIECHNSQTLFSSECINKYDDMIDIENDTQMLDDVKFDMSKMSNNVGGETAPGALNVGKEEVSSDDDNPLQRLRSKKRVKLIEDTEYGSALNKRRPITSEHRCRNTDPAAAHQNEEHKFSCHQCSYNTTNECHLKAHLLTHTDEKPFSLTAGSSDAGSTPGPSGLTVSGNAGGDDPPSPAIEARPAAPSDSAAERARDRPSAALLLGLVGLVPEAEPRDISIPPPPPTPFRPGIEASKVTQTPGDSLHVTGETTPSGVRVRRVAEAEEDVPLCCNVYERMETMDVEEEEAEEVLSTAPWHVRRWMGGLPSEVSVSVPTSANPDTDSIRVEDNVVVATGVTTTWRHQAAGSDFDSEFDDEFDVGATEGIERDIPGDEELDEPLRNIIQEMERGMDDAIDSRLGLSPNFDWVEDFASFRGVPEEFSGPRPGPVEDYDSPFDAFTDIFDRDIMEKIVLETNRYAKQTIDDLKDRGVFKRSSRLNRWKDTDVEEMMVFFGVLMYMGIDPRTSVAEYWITDVLEMPKFKSLMSYNRYILLNKFLHFVDNSDVCQNRPQNADMCSGDRAMHQRVWKLSPLLKHLQEKFRSLYNLKQSVAIDESLLLFKGRLSWAQTIRSKAARFGIKSYELCESVTGYMARFQIYTGKSSDGTSTDVSLSADLGGKSAKVVLELLKGLERRGHRVTMDNFYNCPSLARYLKSQGFDCFGTLRPNRRHVPEAIAKVPENVPEGTIVARHSGDVSIVAWKDSKVVTVISTFHDAGTCVSTKAGRTIVKPKSVSDYNSTMGGVDLKDQKLSAYLLERKRCVKWYVKIFKRLLNVSIHNAYIMYAESLRRRNKLAVTHREFRYALAKSMVERVPRVVPVICQGITEITRLRRDICHVPNYSTGEKNRRNCIVCTQKNKRKAVHSQCVTCNVFLCFENCWQVWHTTDNFEIKRRGRKRTRDE